MKYQPIPKSPQRRLFFITDVSGDGAVEISNLSGDTKRFSGGRADMALLSLSDAAIYCLVNPKELILAGDGPAAWKAHKRHNRKTKMTYHTGQNVKGTTVYPLAQFTKDPTELEEFFGAIGDLGIKYESLSTMARNSWLRLLSKPVDIWSPASANGAVTKAFTGGRREAVAEKRTYFGLAYMDMPAAYLKSMEAPLPTKLVEAEPRMYPSGVAEATVIIPEHDGWKPLPLTKRERDIILATYATGVVSSAWTFEELMLAETVGYEVQINRAWKGIHERELFAEWLPWAYALRGVPGASGKLAKAFTTRLWALFGLNGSSSRTLIEFDEDGKQLPSRKLAKIKARPDTKFISATIASRTRIDLWPALYSGGVWADTDGVIIPLDRATRFSDLGWKKKEEIGEFQLRDWAHTRYHCIQGDREQRGMNGCPTCEPPRWHYRCDGSARDSEDAIRAWDLQDDGEFMETSPDGIVVPSMETSEFQRFKPRILTYDRLDSQAI